MGLYRVDHRTPLTVIVTEGEVTAGFEQRICKPPIPTLSIAVLVVSAKAARASTKYPDGHALMFNMGLPPGREIVMLLMSVKVLSVQPAKIERRPISSCPAM
jgi:hypothetical protein